MAVTSLWPITGRLDKVINYTRNPEKTREQSYADVASLHKFSNVIEYAADEVKTEAREYVSGINCTEGEAARQFLETKRHYSKNAGRLCYHGYQSFRAGEVDAKTAHKIGVELAARLWGDRFEVLVATHCNTGHYHNHFVINSVSFVDGYKFYNSHEDYRRMREESDRLCKEYGLAQTPNKSRRRNYGLMLAEKNGKPTLAGRIRTDIDRAVLASTTDDGFVKVLTEMGYELRTRGKYGDALEHPKIKPPFDYRFFRFDRLGEEYELERVLDRVNENIRKLYPFPEADDETIKQYNYVNQIKATGIHALYIRYCYSLHIIEAHPSYIRRVHFSLQEDIIKLNKLDAETRFLGKSGLSTGTELAAYRSSSEVKISELLSQRSNLRTELRRAERSGDTSTVDRLKVQISSISGELKTARKEVKLCSSIEERSSRVQANLSWLEQEKEAERKENEQNELFGRRGRTGREDKPERG